MTSKLIKAKNVLLIGQCIAQRTEDAARVRVKQLEFDSYLNMYFGKFVNFYAQDTKQLCEEGDIVLIRKLHEQTKRDITFDLVKVLYKLGDVVDPISGEKCVGKTYRETIKLEDQLYGIAADGTGGFDYDSAPERGWQLNKKDFSHRVGYQKFHEFEPNHPSYKDPAAT